jgi:hypothetical protein
LKVVRKRDEEYFIVRVIAAKQGAQEGAGALKFAAIAHAGARIEENCEANRLLPGAEECDLLRPAVFKKREIRGCEPFYGVALLVGDLNGDGLKSGVASEDRRLRERCQGICDQTYFRDRPAHLIPNYIEEFPGGLNLRESSRTWKFPVSLVTGKLPSAKHAVSYAIKHGTYARRNSGREPESENRQITQRRTGARSDDHVAHKVHADYHSGNCHI